MKRQEIAVLITSLVLVSLIFLTGCQATRLNLEQTPTPFLERGDNEEGDPFIGVPNPASFYCQEMGYELELRDVSGGTLGMCVFPDGNECEEWDFLAGGCGAEWSFCQRQGYKIKAGDNIGSCVYPDGSTCSEYDFFIGECEAPK
ncbi:MAG: DUF333 domain-containing protein [Anaerolineales bacterium]|nr:DUF333 domain-containing protein [Anaerolineales bacterium]